MDRQEAAFVEMGRRITTLSIQTAMLSFLIESLIATHPDPGAVRNVFDQMWGQFQAGQMASTGEREDWDLMRAMLGKMFPD